MNGTWEYDPILRGWRYVIQDNCCTWRTWAAYKQLPAVEFALKDALRGDRHEFQRTGDNEFTLPARL